MIAYCMGCAHTNSNIANISERLVLQMHHHMPQKHVTIIQFHLEPRPVESIDTLQPTHQSPPSTRQRSVPHFRSVQSAQKCYRPCQQTMQG